MSSNSNSQVLAAVISQARQGTFTGLVQRLKGTERAGAVRGGPKVTYGDDKVHVTLFTGFRYDALCQRSLDTIGAMDPNAILAQIKDAKVHGWEGRGDKAVPVDITLEHVQEALDRLTDAWTLSRDGENASTNDHVFEPLVVNGETVRGCRVYTGWSDADLAEGKVDAAPKGTIYLHGLQIGRKVLEEAPNGPAPKTKSAPRVAAEAFITNLTPMGAYRSYILKPGAEYTLRAGGAAVVAADADGITITSEIKAALRAAEAAAAAAA